MFFMLFSARKAAAQPPLNLASQPGVAVGVQLAGEAAALRPRLAQWRVCEVNGTSPARLERMARELGLRHTPVRVLLEEGEYQFLQAEMPQVPAEELRTALAWQLKALLRQPVEATTLDVLAPKAESPRRSGFVVAAANQLVLERMLMFRPWNSPVRAIDVPEMAQRNLADRLEEPGRATALLSITPAACLLTVSHEGVLYFSRRFDLTTLSLSGNEAGRREQFDRLVLELQRTVDMLEHQFSFFSVSALWLAPFAHAYELLSLLIENFYLPVKAIDLNEIFDASACPLPADPDQLAALFHALGMALRGPGGAP
jgi:MSHA biogenesis protein MshI